MNRREYLRWSLACAVGISGLAACGADDRSGGGTAAGPRPLTTTEAALLAGCLYKNYDVGGATFELTATFPGTPDSITVDGSIDWRNHLGRASVVGAGRETGVSEVFWGEDHVIEARAGLSDALRSSGHPGAGFVRRRPDPTRRQLDGLLGLVLGLAAEQRDNPQLVQQNDSARFERTDTVRGIAATVVQYDGSEFWLDRTGSLLRFVAAATGVDRRVTVDITSLGTIEIRPPDEEAVVDHDAVAAAYDALVS